MTLQPYQYSLGGVVFGRGTEIPISKVDVQPYNQNVQDAQSPRSDEIRFGIDTLAPGAITFTMAVMDNQPSVAMEGLTKQYLNDELMIGIDTQLPSLAKVWKSRNTRMTWGAAIPLLFCGRGGQVRRIYGRPGKFAHTVRSNDGTMWIDVMAEFRRMDTYSHNDIEYFVGPVAPNGDTDVAERAEGDADSWVRIIIEGPAVHPIIVYGEQTLELDMTIEAGQLVEISSYPWARRVVDNEGINWRRKLIGSTKYLDQIQFPADFEFEVSWQATGTTGDSGMYFFWREAYNVF